MALTPAIPTAPETQDGPIVAVQYPSDEKLNKSMTLQVGDGAIYAEKYAHLKQLATDDKPRYKELKAAIKHIIGLRTDNASEEKVIKDPLNEFRGKVIALGKLLRKEIAPVEADLVAEKKRIDDIIAEELEAQKRLWNENVQIIRARGNVLPGWTMEQLTNELEIINLCSLDDLDFGEYIEDAKEDLANARIRVEMAIEQEKQRLDLITQQAEIARQQAEAAEKETARLAEQAAKDYANDWDSAHMADELFEMKQKQAAMQAEADKPESPEKTDLTAPHFDMGAEPVTESVVCDDSGEAVGISNGYKIESVASFFDDDDEPAAPKICANDDRNLMLLIAKLKATADSIGVYESEVCSKSVARVRGHLEHMQIFLARIREQ